MKFCVVPINTRLVYVIIHCFLCLLTDGRKHRLILENDDRHYILASSFGFQRGGLLTLTVSGFHAFSANSPEQFNGTTKGRHGFTIDKSRNFEVANYFEKNQEACIFGENDKPRLDNSTAMILVEIIPDGPNEIARVIVNKQPSGGSIDGVDIFSCSQTLVELKLVDHLVDDEKGQSLSVSQQARDASYPELHSCSALENGNKAKLIKRDFKYYFSIAIWLGNVENEGAYSVFYHNCPNYENRKATRSSLTIDIVERNGNDYLAVGERFSPTVYFIMAFLFLATAFVWGWILHTAKRDVYKLHYVMLILVFLKAASLLCHGVNYHFISALGAPLEGWAILFYITHLLKGALLFITLVLIGTGWAFIKNFLTSKEKKIFIIVIPFQVLANIAYIILEESETGDYRYTMWGYIFMLVDFFCCGCILIPIVWSIRHLSEAASTDGKAASNLQRMRLFRRFYMLVVCYIYFTRIVVMIFDMTVPFRYTYLNTVFREGGTFIFFLLTGYTFRPTLENPYLLLSQEDADNDNDDVEMDDVVVYDRKHNSDQITLRSSAKGDDAESRANLIV
ncbi:LOW QUALITY PROTEIN: protein GPR107-like [Paramacrobiotus metropolitanus]|uniref:LOW QUALITY PROTEIN: protein GPR107-like n=1 Tax=Paramacrobiotus metropolitanus TaxID=2943436 RepID=UPI002445A7D8|nr:LOW QUALITY PROTEIN: protein GPR107-like [Paramacrobiotus metropolitanus]